jgi:hypothetical protein
MKTLLALALSMLTMTAQAAIDWNASARYWYHQNVSTNVPHTLDFVAFAGNDNASVSVSWRTEALHGVTPPTRAQLIALEPTAVAFWASRTKDDKAAITEASPAVLRAVIAVLLDEINILRAKAALQPRTAQQMKDAIRGKLE